MSVFPGAVVRYEDDQSEDGGEVSGEVGRIERVEPGGILVRAPDGRAFYRFPMDRVEMVVRDGDDKVATVSVGPDDIRQYETSDVIAAPEADASPEAEDGTASVTEVARIPLAAESLEIEHRPVRLGTTRIHKGVRKGEQRVNVPVWHEDVVVERIPAEQFDTSALTDPNEIVIPLVEERLVIQKRQVVTEYVRIRKRPVTEERVVSETLRREYLEVERLDADVGQTDGDPPDRYAGGEADSPEPATPEMATRKPATRKRRSRKSGARKRAGE